MNKNILLSLCFLPFSLCAMESQKTDSESRKELRKDFQALVSYCTFMKSFNRNDAKAQSYYDQADSLAEKLFKQPTPAEVTEEKNPYNLETESDKYFEWIFDQHMQITKNEK